MWPIAHFFSHIIYIIINLAYLWVVPASELAQATAPAAIVAQRIFGNIGGKIITVGILISVFGALNGYLLTGPRVAYTLAVKKTLPLSDTLSKLNNGDIISEDTIDKLKEEKDSVVCFMGCAYVDSLINAFKDIMK